MPPLPSDLDAIIAGYSWTSVITGCSASNVFHLMKAGSPSLYLKQSVGELHSLLDEKIRLEWLRGKLPVPEVIGFAGDRAHHHLLISEIPGPTAADRIHHRTVEGLVESLAEGLRMVHAVPIADCPFDHLIASEIERARERMERGLVDEEDFDDERRGGSAKSLFEELTARIPDEDPVFTHGDYCLPNVIMAGGGISGFIDLGRGGIGDRYRDLALAARSLAFNFGEQWVPLLFEAYGIGEPDPGKLAFHRLLDEFF
jgi:kanamycin kinase/aminoglycoside 3'-phosphotransferase-2